MYHYRQYKGNHSFFATPNNKISQGFKNLFTNTEEEKDSVIRFKVNLSNDIYD